MRNRFMCQGTETQAWGPESSNRPCLVMGLFTRHWEKGGGCFFEATGGAVREEHKFGSDGTTAKWMTTQWIRTVRE